MINMKREISIKTLRKMKVGTLTRKTDTPRGAETVSKSQVQIGDKVVLDNYFTLITE